MCLGCEIHHGCKWGLSNTLRGIRLNNDAPCKGAFKEGWHFVNCVKFHNAHQQSSETKLAVTTPRKVTVELVIFITWVLLSDLTLPWNNVYGPMGGREPITNLCGNSKT